ncbi:amidase [Idiomarina tyrosinivorans]|uniref:Amidase n=1 Tax=Idiomarina tyrosinivorans TaxID=1445662 RepID=A0A432ZK43_9GAMM|nr:amidase [Idiomarina tyrosinivorans]RUO78200.1 amidase [Idiomarina tyrosinivorans]
MRKLTALFIVLLLSACQSAPQQQTNSIAVQQSQDLSTLQYQTFSEIQAALNSGQVSSEQLVHYYISRIKANNREGMAIHAVIALAPDAIEQAQALDEMRQQGQIKGPLHGIPVLLKDNIDTGDGMANTGGSVLLRNNRPDDDAQLVASLRAAGAIILGKANLSEWANFRSTRSSSGWSGMGGQALNPYDLSRSTCGSSAGSATAVAADFVTLAVGTETDGSVVCPAATNGIVGIKPTLGLVSRDGIIPIAHSQDTAGSMARTVTGAVNLLQAMKTQASNDPLAYQDSRNFTQYLQADGLKGLRIGVVRNLMGYHEKLDQQFEQQLDVLRAEGAVIVDNANIPTLGQWDDAEFTVLVHEMKHDMAAYLATTDGDLKSLADLIRANKAYHKQELTLFGQELFEMSQATTEEQHEEYLAALARSKRLAGPEGIDATLKKYNVDLLIAPTNGPAWKIDHVNGDHYLGSASSPAAVAGYPHITVPMGFVQLGEEPALPVGMSFFSGAKSEPLLIKAAYSYEQASQQRRPPNW